MWRASQARNSTQVKQRADHQCLGKLKMAQYSPYVQCSVGEDKYRTDGGGSGTGS